MKQYGAFSTVHISSPGSFSIAGTRPADSCVTLGELQTEGWKVLAAAIEPAPCKHEDARYLFVLERENPTPEGEVLPS